MATDFYYPMSIQPQEVLSPITHKPAELIDTIPSSMIISSYKKNTDIDVSSYFKDLPEIYIYKCNQTGYRFYYPFSLPGDAHFYEKLQKYDWYYADWKWDYDATFPYIDNGSKVLDIGCGYGSFIAHLAKEKNCDCTGLEFNDKAIETGKSKGLNIHKISIEEYANTHENEYDNVCFFQVLEHIWDIDGFMKAAIKCLKPGGKLFICVPNNNPYFYQFEPYESLNLPPHHMGLWNEQAFKGLATVYSLKIHAVQEERLNRFRFYTRMYIENAAGNNSFKKGLMNLFKVPITAYFVLVRKTVKVGSILMVYEKGSTSKNSR